MLCGISGDPQTLCHNGKPGNVWQNGVMGPPGIGDGQLTFFDLYTGLPLLVLATRKTSDYCDIKRLTFINPWEKS